MESLTIIWIIVCLYLLLNLLVGVYCHIRVKDSTDYLLAGRRIGGVLMTAGTLAATEIGGGSTVGVAAKAYGSWGPISRMVRSLRRHRRYSGCFHSTTPTARHGDDSAGNHRASIRRIQPSHYIHSVHAGHNHPCGRTDYGNRNDHQRPHGGAFNRTRHPHLRRGARYLHHVRRHVERYHDGRDSFLRPRGRVHHRGPVRAA